MKEYISVVQTVDLIWTKTSDKFSRLDFMQFGQKSYNNEGAYATLKYPDFETPSFHTFKAVDKPKV